jgi:hypothetical protein
MKGARMDRSTEELASLHGLSLADLFKKLVLEHPEVVAAGRAVIEQTRKYSAVFEEGQSVGPFVEYTWALDATTDGLAYAFVAPVVHWLGDPLPKPPPVIVDAAAALAARIQLLRRLLTGGRIFAKGMYCQTGITGEIGRLQWARQDTLVDVRNSDLLQAINHKPVTIWTGIWIEVAEAIRDAAVQKARERVESSTAAINECTRWLVDVMNASPGERQGTKDSWWARAANRWPKTLSRRGFDKAWADAVRQSKASAWAAAGAPRKSVQQSTR